MFGKIQGSSNTQFNKTHPLWLIFSKNKRLNYIMFPALIIMFVFIFAFQNCQKRKNPSEGVVIKESNTSNPSPSTTTSTLVSHIGDKAIFEISEKYTGEKAIPNIRWQVMETGLCDGNNIIIAEGTESNIEVDWNSFLDKSVSVEAFIQFEGDDCITYRQQNIRVNQLSGSICDTDRYTFDILSTLSSDDLTRFRRYFSVGSSVDLEFRAFGPDELDFDSFTWSLQKIFVKDEEERADQTNNTVNLTYHFSEIGLYNVVVEASRTDLSATTTTTSSNTNTEPASVSRQLLIGKCEGENLDDIEIVLSDDSFGYETPKNVLYPIWNYVRPVDTDYEAANVVTVNDTEGYPSGRHIYRYPRGSKAKFIDIDIQNADECFLDQDPVPIGETCSGCSENSEGCTSSCHTEYGIREGLSPLPSCRGNALDMSTLDLDITICTDDIFVVAASKKIDISLLPTAELPVMIPSSEGSGSSTQTLGTQAVVNSITDNENKNKKTLQTEHVFYKHCPADSDYCYFGPETYRPEEHHCSDE